MSKIKILTLGIFIVSAFYINSNIVKADVLLDTLSRDFGNREINPAVPYSHDVHVINNTNDIITVTYTLSGDSSFSIGTNNTVIHSTPIGFEDSLTITFYPTSSGAKTATLKVTATPVNGDQILLDQNVSLSGTGVESIIQPPGGTNGNINGGGISLKFPNPLGGTDTIAGIVKNIINGIFGLLGAVAVGMIVYGGVMYMTGGSSKDGVEKGKKIITSAVVGLIVVLLSLAIVDLLFVLLGGR